MTTVTTATVKDFQDRTTTTENPSSGNTSYVPVSFPSLNKSDLSEAARHMSWQAELTRLYGSEIAAKVGDIHEVGVTPQQEADSHRDQKNNVVGRSLAHDLINDRERVPMESIFCNENVNDYETDYRKLVEAGRPVKEALLRNQARDKKARALIEQRVEQAIRDGRATGINGQKIVVP